MNDIFIRTTALVGEENFLKIKKAHVVLCGCGGVGSYAFEALVRTGEGQQADILVAAGYGVAKEIDKVIAFTDRIGGELVATRRMVDEGILPYDRQVGLTGRTVAPPVYMAIGVSGAVQFAAGMKASDCIVAINTDPAAPIFDIAHYCITGDVNEILPKLIEKIKGVS